MKSQIIFSLILLPLLILRCDKAVEPNEVNTNELLLQYQFMHGWTGKKSDIQIFKNKATRIQEGKEIEISLLKTEKDELNNFIENFSKVKQQYNKSDGIWMDIDYHLLIKNPETSADSISIFEPIDSDNIPNEIKKAITILSSKL